MSSMSRESRVHIRSFWQLQLVGWGCFYAWDLLGSMPDLLGRQGALREYTVSAAFMFLGSCFLRSVCRFLLRRSSSLVAFEIRAAVWAIVTANACSVVTVIVLRGYRNMSWPDLAPIAMESTFVLFMWCTLYFSIKQWQQSALERERLLRAETDAREATLRALRSQLNPHFLFNSLNAVSTLVLDGNVSAATRMLAQIGDLLRMSLDSEVMTEVALSQELAFTERYLAIEQTRLGERLHVNMAISSATLDALVPSMFLQPLVENAVRHGVASLVEGGRIGIESGLYNDRLRIVVRNSGRRTTDRQREQGNGVGLSNTAERLKTLYQANYKFSMIWPEAGGCEVELELPFRRVSVPQEVSSCAR